ncbi:acetyl-CoA carboxylase biotin carboxyl carrier protein subunit [Psychroflexus maritimus]|uniref:Acetyl-CoA carboxylase biotin carboxyl carrier protein subunit n=1 Tax=Psychroflexus maritimus TaxID=2714865 RepID=A0A967AB54_9FLAO|nr:acetyl-CoA carboxylase biotin carboxyl carrier protein subunit [Psychroflexus maritimus]NGZ89004.1 acetyl-CoA carboxylase biotin carboxyl carrier protein subunit [Psychroflexus maritimus]
MHNQLKAKVDEQYEFEFEQAEISDLDAVQINAKEFHVIHQNQSFHAQIIAEDFHNQTYTIKVKSNTYQVKISNPLDLLINKMGLTLNTGVIESEIKAPMPGLILDIPVAEGDTVKVGDTLIVLEAMKMENALSSPMDGVVKAIHVKSSDSVAKSELLIELE